MDALKWIIGAIVVFGIAVGGVMFGIDLMPPREVAQGKGTLIPWLMTWALVWTTALMGVIISCYMVAAALGKTHSQ